MADSQTTRIRRLLGVVRWVAVADALLLVVLVVAALSHAESVVDVLGPIHGFGFLALMYLVTRGAFERLWGWWFPAVVLVTAGPPGSLYGDLRVRRALAAA